MKTVSYPLNPLTEGKPYYQEGKEAFSSSKQEATSSSLFLRKGPNCRVKIILKPTGRVQAYLSREEDSYHRVSLKGIPSFIAANKGDRAAQMLQGSYVVFHRNMIEIKPRGCGGMKRRDKSQTMLPHPNLLQLDTRGHYMQLNGNYVNDTDAKAIARTLEKNQNLQSLELRQNEIGDAGAQALAGALEKSLNLQYLNLSLNQIGDAGAKALAEVLEKKPNLLQLSLRMNQIGESGALALAGALEKNLNLLQLNLSYNQIGDVGARALAGLLEKNLNLQQLNLSNNQIGDVGALALAEGLEKNLNLWQLKLNSNQIGDAGAQALGNALRVNQTLQHLVLWRNQISDVGALALAGALKKNLNLLLLDLGFNQIGNAGAQALGNVLQVNQTLQHLFLGRNHIDDVEALAGALEKNQNLLQLNIEINDESLQTQIETLLRANRRIADIFREQTGDLQTFIQLHQNQLITEEENFLSFQKEIERQHEKLETLRASIEELIHQTGRMRLSESYRKKIEAIATDLNSLLLKAFEDNLALLSKGYFAKESSEERKITLGRSLYQVWTSFFGSQCPDWLKEKGRSFTTFCLLLSMAEGKEEALFDSPGMIFQRICQFNQSKI